VHGTCPRGRLGCARRWQPCGARTADGGDGSANCAAGAVGADGCPLRRVAERVTDRGLLLRQRDAEEALATAVGTVRQRGRLDLLRSFTHWASQGAGEVSGRIHHQQQAAALLQLGGAVAAGQQAVVPDLQETPGQNVLQEAAQEPENELRPLFLFGAACGCNREVKKAAQTKRRVNRFRRQQYKKGRQKPSRETLCLLTAEAIERLNETASRGGGRAVFLLT
jgi:hypothetical protein